MSSADAMLVAMGTQCTALRGMALEVAKEAAPEIEAAVRKTAAAGTTIEGVPWPATRAGARALPNAASAITARAVGTTVVISLKGPYVFHNSAAGKDRRRILPEEGTPPVLAKILLDAGARVFRRLGSAR